MVISTRHAVYKQIGKGNLNRMLIPDTDRMWCREHDRCNHFACRYVGIDKRAFSVFERKENVSVRSLSPPALLSGTRSTDLPADQNIFFKNSPLHDGAMIDPCRTGVCCPRLHVLPAAFSNQGLSRDLRQHAPPRGCQLSETTADSVLVVVSRETSAISLSPSGMLQKRHLSLRFCRRRCSRASCSAMNSRNRNEKGRIAAIRDKWKGGAGK